MLNTPISHNSPSDRSPNKIEIPREREPKIPSPVNIDENKRVCEETVRIHNELSDVKQTLAMYVAQLNEVSKKLEEKLNKVEIDVKAESEKRRGMKRLIDERLASFEEHRKKERTLQHSPATNVACVLCSSSAHALANCQQYPTNQARAEEFKRRNLCRRCTKAHCSIKTCTSAFVICNTCASQGVRDHRAIHHLTELCVDHLREKALKKENIPPGHRQQKRQLHKNNDGLPSYVPMSFPMNISHMHQQMVPVHPQQPMAVIPQHMQMAQIHSQVPFQQLAPGTYQMLQRK